MEKQKGTTKDRMKEVLAVLGVSASEFETRCGLAHGFVARVSREITKKTRAKIKAVYPKLNINYIALGSGDVFLKDGEAEQTIKGRLEQFCGHMNISKRELVRNTGIAESFIWKMSENIRKSSLDKIYRAYPLLNPEWLEYGEGEMLMTAPKRKDGDDVSARIDALADFLGLTMAAFRSETGIATNKKNVTKATVDRIVKRYPFVNPLWLMHGSGKMISVPAKSVRTKFQHAPLVSQRAFAGYLTGFADEEYMDSLDKIPYVEDEEVHGNVIAIEVSGDSMDDGTAEAYRNGDIVLAKEIPTGDPLPIRRYDFVIVHKNGILIKRIAGEDRKHGTLTIHSLNPEYGDVEISAADVMKIFIVVMRMSKQKR